jgi:hypothetical protein
MVTVNDYKIRETSEGKPFISLELMGDMELVQSAKTGRFYATTRRCFISSTFDEATAKRMIGKQMKGNIIKVEAEPYDYTIPETGEVIQLSHRYDYTPNETAHHFNDMPLAPKQFA